MRGPGPGRASGTEPLGDDLEALGRLLTRLAPRLTAVARRVVRDRSAAADVVQNAFEKVVRHRRRFEGRSKPSTWMHRIVVNEAYLWLRTERRRGPQRCSEADWRLAFCPDLEDPLDAAHRSQHRARLYRALADLAPADQEVLVALDLEERSHLEVGAELGLSALGAKSRAYRARMRLKARLQPEEER